MQFKFLLLGFVLIISLGKTSPILAQAEIFPTPSIIASSPIEYALPYPGILPDHPLYFLKLLRDRLLLFFTRDEVKKIHLNLLFADKRLVMGQILFEEGKTEVAVDTITKGEKYLLNSAALLVSLKKERDLPPGLADKIELSAKKHDELIKGFISASRDERVSRRLTDASGLTHQAISQIAQIK